MTYNCEKCNDILTTSGLYEPVVEYKCVCSIEIIKAHKYLLCDKCLKLFNDLIMESVYFFFNEEKTKVDLLDKIT